MKEDEENILSEPNKDEDEENNYLKKIVKLNDYQLEHKYLFRICLLGNAGVGKTSLITRFCDNSFKENYNNTIGVDFRLVTLQYGDIISKLHIWDTAGQERFRSLALNYINNSHAFIFIYDISDKSSFENLQNWIKIAFDKNKNSIVNLLIGNKCDKEDERQISQSEGEQMAKEKKFYFLETSAKNDENVLNLFYYITYKLIGYYNENENEYVENENVELCSSSTEELPTMRVTESSCKC
jgi:Ras-related protein Rab-1A